MSLFGDLASGIGQALGAGIGSLGGPLGTMIGREIGGVIGDFVAGAADQFLGLANDAAQESDLPEAAKFVLNTAYDIGFN
ncbi:hypothetical protein [Lysobacter sp. Hz 25]|uniref:hypothetical protein n=1 Tax=Lysobacter sp. Hz 25 TaxID=3383698 RepID=UPI0038D464B5